MDLQVAAVQAHCVAVDGRVGTFDHTIHQDQQDQTQHNRDHSNGCATPVAPHVPPSQFDQFKHLISPLLLSAHYLHR